MVSTAFLPAAPGVNNNSSLMTPCPCGKSTANSLNFPDVASGSETVTASACMSSRILAATARKTSRRSRLEVIFVVRLRSNCNGDLTRSLAEEFDILWRVGCLGRPCDHQASKRSTSINEWNQTGALQVFGDHFIVYLRRNSGRVGHVNDGWVQCLQNALSGSAYRVDHVL